MPVTPEDAPNFPTLDSVLETMREFRAIGSDAFIEKYSPGKGRRLVYVVHKGVNYPLWPLWAAYHRPPVKTAECDYRQGSKFLRKHDFNDRWRPFKDGALSVEDIATEISDKRAYLEVVEGRRLSREIEYVQRHAGIIAQAKSMKEPVCEACGFDFSKVYGEHGEGFIECHHLTPVSQRGEEGSITSIDDLAMLCSNCHRMVHYRSELLSVDALRKMIGDVKQAKSVVRDKSNATDTVEV